MKNYTPDAKKSALGGYFLLLAWISNFVNYQTSIINKAIIELDSLEKMRFAHSTLLQNIVLRVLVNFCFLYNKNKIIITTI